ncbi:MAG TPA: hypothetical protein VG013_17905 [Gemmataceae bacterium]|nr:hypothetical protein [Gemmataceae bacterium]
MEETHGDFKIIGYRFPEDASLPADVNNIRFNFSPCFVTVGDQFVACSTLELGHQLVDLLYREMKPSARPGGLGRDPGAMFDRFANGKTVLRRSDLASPFLQTMFDRTAEFAGITNGEMTRKQWVEVMGQMRAARGPGPRGAGKEAGLPVEREQFYAAGIGEALEDVKEQLFAQTVLGQALPPEEARQQVRALIDWVRGLGVLRFDGRYESQATHFDIQMKLGASRAPYEGTRKDSKPAKKE